MDINTNLSDLLLSVINSESGRREVPLNIIHEAISRPQYLQEWSHKIPIESFVHLILVIVEDSEGFDILHHVMSIIVENSEFQIVLDETQLNNDRMADLVDKVGNETSKPYALLYAMIFRVLARQEISAVFFSREYRLDHLGVLLALSQSCSTETEEHALSAIFNFGVISQALPSIIGRDSSYLTRLAKIVLEGTLVGKHLALTMLAQLVYKHMDRKKALSSKSLKLIPYLVQIVRDNSDAELRTKAIKLLSGIAEVPENKIEFVSSTSNVYLLPDLFNILDEQQSETRTFAILILWALSKDHKTNQELLLSPQFHLIPKLLRILMSPSECRGKALGLLGVIFENSRLYESLVHEDGLASQILAIAAEETDDKVRTNALIIMAKMAESSVWKGYLMSQGTVLLDQLAETALSEEYKTARGFAIRVLYCLAVELPIVAKYVFKFVGLLLDLMEKDESLNKFRAFQFLSSVMSNEDNQRNILYEAQKRLDTSLLFRLISTVLEILRVPDNLSSQLSMTKSVAIDVIRALCDKNPPMQTLLFFSDVKFMDALGMVLDNPDPISGNYDPKVVVLQLLFIMGGNDDLKSAFVDPKYNFVGRLLRIILIPPTRENSRAKKYAAGSICRLVSMHTDNQILFANRSLGALPILVDCIRNRDTPWKTKEFAVGALVHIARLPANHWIAYDPDLSLLPTTFELLREAKNNSNTLEEQSKSAAHDDEIRFYLLGVVEDLLEAYDRPDATQLDSIQRDALLSEVFDIGSEPSISATKAKALRILLMLSVETGHILTIRAHRLDLVQILVSFLTQVCEPLSTASSAQMMGEKERSEYLRCINQFTSNKRAKSITSFLIRDGFHLLPTLYRFLTLPTTTPTEEKLVSSILWNLAENGNQSVSVELVRHNIHVIALDILQDTIRKRAVMDEFRTQLLNMLMNMARHFSVREALKTAGAVEIAETLLDYSHRENNFQQSVFLSSATESDMEPTATATSRNRSNTDDIHASSSHHRTNNNPSRSNNPTNSLKALLILLFLFGNEEAASEIQEPAASSSTLTASASASSSPLKTNISREVVTSERLKTLIEIFSLTLQCRGGKDFFLGTFCLPLIIDACLVISQSDSNKAGLISLGVTPLLTKVLMMYVNNQSAIPYCGGGGKDEEAATLAIETLTHLSFSFGTNNNELQDKFLRNNTLLLEILPALQDKANISLESKNKAVILQYRLTIRDGRSGNHSTSRVGSVSSHTVSHANHEISTSVSAMNGSSANPVDVRRISMVDSSTLAQSDTSLADISVSGIDTPTSTVGKPKHVMVSYCWEPSSNPSYVKKLAQELRRLGFDVWRDEDGSTLSPAVSGAVDDRLAEAIELSDTIIICVSAAYKRSSSCRLEATYAHALARRNKVNLVFVMMNDYYTTISHPHHCDGWLGFMIGDSFWHSMWQEPRISVVAGEIAKTLSEETKLVNRERPVSTSSRRRSLSNNNSAINNTSADANIYPTFPSLSNSNNLTNNSALSPVLSHSKPKATAATSNNTSNSSSVYVMQQENPMLQQFRRSSSGGNNTAGRSIPIRRELHSVDDEDGNEEFSAFSIDDVYNSNGNLSNTTLEQDSISEESSSRSVPLHINTAACAISPLPPLHTSSSAHSQSKLSNQGRPPLIHSSSTGSTGTRRESINSNYTAMASNPLAAATRRPSQIHSHSTINKPTGDELIPSASNVLFTPSPSPSSFSFMDQHKQLQQQQDESSVISRSSTNYLSRQTSNHLNSNGSRMSLRSSINPNKTAYTNMNNPSPSLSMMMMLQHQMSTSSISNQSALPEDTMTEITSEDDALATAWRLLHCLELVKDENGLEEYLLEEGVKSVELLGYCDPEDWQHIASFLRNKPRKRFLELMHQWHAVSMGTNTHQLLATPLANMSAASSVAPAVPHHQVPANGAANNAHISKKNDSGDIQAADHMTYRIGLSSSVTESTLSHGNSHNNIDNSCSNNNSLEDTTTTLDHDETSGPNIMCSLPEFCVIS